MATEVKVKFYNFIHFVDAVWYCFLMEDETPAMTFECFPKAAVDIWKWMLNVNTQLPISGFYLCVYLCLYPITFNALSFVLLHNICEMTRPFYQLFLNLCFIIWHAFVQRKYVVHDAGHKVNHDNIWAQKILQKLQRDIMGKLLRSQRSANNERPARKHYYHHSVRDFKLDCIQDSKGPTVNVRAPYLSVFNSMSSLFLLKLTMQQTSNWH